MSSLNTLHVDAADIGRLYISGDILLKCLLRHGGVQSFRVIHPIVFPRVVAQFRALKAFHLKLTNKIVSKNTGWLDADLSLLPPGLEEVVLDFHGAYNQLSLAQRVLVACRCIIVLNITFWPQIFENPLRCRRQLISRHSV